MLETATRPGDRRDPQDDDPAPRPPVRHHAHDRRRRLCGDQGEGVISAAIAVLIMAFLGALMWVSFQKMWQTTETNTNKHIEQMTQE